MRHREDAALRSDLHDAAEIHDHHAIGDVPSWALSFSVPQRWSEHDLGSHVNVACPVGLLFPC